MWWFTILRALETKMRDEGAAWEDITELFGGQHYPESGFYTPIMDDMVLFCAPLSTLLHISFWTQVHDANGVNFRVAHGQDLTIDFETEWGSWSYALITLQYWLIK